MVSCPSCQRPVEITEQNKGTLFTCPHCGAVYFIDWNGQPEVAQAEDAVVSEEIAPPPYESQGFESAGFDGPVIENPLENSFSNNQFNEPVADEIANPQDYAIKPGDNVVDFNMPLENPMADSAVASSNDNYSSDGFSGSMEGLEEAPYDFSQALDANVNPSPSDTSDTADFSDVTDFANATTAVGPLSYTLVIEGIESSALVKQLREAMMDSRFRWDVSGLIDSIRGGKLVIPNLGPAKSAVFLNRIKYLPFKISWRQDVLSSN